MKKLTALLLCAVLALTLTVPAFAEAAAPLLRGTYTVEEDDIVCVSLPVDGDGSVTVLADGEPTEHFTLSTVADEEIPITFVCVVDYSTNLKEVQKEQMMAALQTISDEMRPVDKMIFMGMGNALDVGKGVLNTKLDREGAILGSWYRYQETYVDRCMKQLAEELTVPGKYDGMNLCVIVISDGVDDINSQQAKNEAYDAIKASGLTINTIALLAPPLTQYAQKHADNLNQFAEISVNGIHVTPTTDNVSAEDAARRIMQATLGAPVVRIDGTRLDRSNDVKLEIQCTTAKGTYSGTVTVDVEDLADIPVYTPPTEPVTQPTEEPTQPVMVETTAPAASEGKTILGFQLPKMNQATLLLMGGIAAAVLGVILMVVAVVAWRQDAEEEEEEEQTVPAEDDGEDDIDEDGEEEIPVPVPVKPVQKQQRVCIIGLLDKNSGRAALRLALKENTAKTIGRTHRSDLILDETDNNLSGIHFQLTWDGEILRIRDCNSTNGTVVNGQLLYPEKWKLLENGDEILAGSGEYVLNLDVE